jgi:hypothetical protein
METNDQRIQGYLKFIIEIISFRNDDQQREILIILQKMEIPEELEGLLFSHCVKVWGTINKKPSVRFNAFKMMAKIAQKHPGLSREIDFLTQDQYLDSLSPTVRKSVLNLSGL